MSEGTERHGELISSGEIIDQIKTIAELPPEKQKQVLEKMAPEERENTIRLLDLMSKKKH